MKKVTWSTRQEIYIYDHLYDCDGFSHNLHLQHEYGVWQCECGFQALFCSKGCMKRALYTKAGILFKEHQLFCKGELCVRSNARYVGFVNSTFFYDDDQKDT